MSWVGGALGAVGSVVGGIVGNSMSSASAANLSQQNYERQKEFAQNGIRWRVADAKAAGLHPLVALGASGASYSPSGVIGGTDTSFIADVATNLGQGIERAVSAKQQREERLRTQAMMDQKLQLDMQTSRAQTDLLDAQTAQIKQDMALQLARSSARAIASQQQVPEMPDMKGGVIAGQGQSYPTGKTQVEISKVPTSNSGDSSTQAGTPPDSRLYRTLDGFAVLPNESTGDVLDAVPGAGLQWAYRNLLVPYLANYLPLTDARRPADHYFDLLSGSYRPGRRFRDYFGY